MSVLKRTIRPAAERKGSARPGRTSRAAAALAGVALLATTACESTGNDAGGDDPETYYEGQTIEIIVPFGAGGGSDLAGRFYAEWLARTLPGSPDVVVVNEEGGGGVVGWNRYATQTEHDGLTLVMGSSTPHSLWVYGSSDVQYDLQEMVPLIGTPTGNIMYVSPESGVQAPEDLLDPDVLLEFPGIVPVGGDLYKVMPLLMLDVNVNETWGYESSGAAAIAFDQGEANVDVASGPNYLQDVLPKVEAGDAIPLLATGQMDGDQLVRDPLAPEVPTVAEVHEILYGEPPSGQMWESYKIQTALVNTLGRTLWVHGDAPEAALTALTETVAQWPDNEEYMAESEEFNGEYVPNVGQDLEELVRINLFEVPQENIDWLADFVKDKYDVDLAEN